MASVSAMRKVVGAWLILALIAVPAQGHQLDHRDPDDVRGRLDIRRVDWFDSMSGGERRVMITIRTFERYKNSDLQTFNGHARIDFDTRGGPRMDRYIRFGYNTDQGIWCEVYTSRDRFAGEGIATRDARTLICAFDRRALAIERHLRWRVSTSNGDLLRTFDEAPAGGRWFAH